jgi:hypothetical protein
MKWFNSLSVVSVMALTLTACGGGGDGGGGGTPPPLTGVFIDSPVQGLSYSSAPSGLSGLTGPNGEFLYRAGDRVTFSIGGYVLVGMDASPVLGQTQVTPFIFLGNTSVPSVTHVGPVNLARLLLALDTVPGGETITLPATPPILPVPTNFGSAIFDTEMENAGIPIASKADAIAHLQKQFAIWGSWATVIPSSGLQVITFMTDGAFMLAHDADPSVAGGVDGMERGTYRWNATTNELTYTVAVDTNGTGGLSHLSASQTPPYTFVIDSSGNSAVLHFGPNGSDQIVFTRVIDASVLFVGAWKLEAPIADFSTVLTIFSDGTFTVASDAIDTQPAGMERGTYVYDAIAGTMTFTTTVDTNGAFGVHDPLTSQEDDVVQATIEESLGQFDFLGITEAPNAFVRFDRVRVP